MIMSRSVLLISALAIATASATHAYWDVVNSGEDVFGNVNVTATSVGENLNMMRFECGSSSAPFLAFLLRDSSREIPEFPAQFIHVDLDGVRHETRAALEPWNENFVAVRVTDRATLFRLASHMIDATTAISVGIVVPSLDLRVGDTFSSQGSTNAGQTIKENCF